MLNPMTLLILSACLPLHLVACFPQQNSIAIAEYANKSKELQQTKVSNSTGIDLRTFLPPVIAKTVDIIQDHSNTLVVEQGKFIENLLDELNALPEKNKNIEALVLDLSNILKRKQELDLHDLSGAALNEKAAFINAIGDVFGDLGRIALSENPTRETEMLQKIVYKLDLFGLNERVKKSLKDAVDKFVELFENLWNSLSDRQRQEYNALNEWYKSFQSKSVGKKFRALPELIRSLQGIIIKNL